MGQVRGGGIEDRVSGYVPNYLSLSYPLIECLLAYCACSLVIQKPINQPTTVLNQPQLIDFKSLFSTSLFPLRK